MNDQNTHRARLRANAKADAAALAGMWAAHLWIGLPALISLPIIWLFGEGDYIVVVLALLWTACFVFGVRIRHHAQVGSAERSKGFWICLWSLILAVSMILLAVAFWIDGTWHWTPPEWY